MPLSIVLATRNPGKFREIKAVLGDLPVDLLGLESFSGLKEPDETGSTFAENARRKAIYYSLATGRWCLADDSGLEVDALGGAPGLKSARYAADRCRPQADRKELDRANNALLLENLQGIPDQQRTARFVCHLALADGERIVIETFDTVEGYIGHHPRGLNGFGYDPLFVHPQSGCTTAELSEEAKNAVSHRGKAVRHFASLLRSFLAQGNPSR